MKRSVAEYLEPRLCPDAIMVGLTVVPADAIALLRAGMMWSLSYDAGRLLGEVSSLDLLDGGYLELLRAWAAAQATPRRPVQRVLLGEAVEPAELAALDVGDSIDLMLARRCLGGEVTAAERAALTARATTESDHRGLARLEAALAAPAGAALRALTDEPIEPLADEPDDRFQPDLYDYVRTGDLAGCRRLLDAAVVRGIALEHAGTPFASWPRLARVCRLVTGDDQAAMKLLERAPLPRSHDDWIEIFGPLGVARIQRAKDAVLAAVDRAFDGVPFPGPTGRSLFQAEAADSYAGCDQARDHKGRWQDLPREHILACQWALPHLAGASLQYYLPAIISFAVREHDQEMPDHGSRWIFESLEYHLLFRLDQPNLRDYGADRHRVFTREQFAAIAAFADYYHCPDEDRARWHALARGGSWPPATG
ncbi:MAG TPA: DUF6714 family protein [Kofleriaceae bacterium]|nr:DUF6714 family protein [Kofleriaceae bacterium]